MTVEPIAPRLALVAPGDDPATDRFLDEVRAAGAVAIPNLQLAFANSVDLARALAAFGAAVRATDCVPAPVLELAILRVAVAAGCPYPFGHHVRIGLEVGVTEEQVRAVVGDWRAAGCFDELDRLVLAVADEVEGGGLGDGTYRALADRLAPDAVVELLVLVSFYGFLCRFVNSAGVPVDDRVADLVARHWPGPGGPVAGSRGRD